ncbi:serum response factor-binding protein 1 isoform X2 [Megalobrama amblycephala]|uniref:serum response factor-binding protein 1 isoform X2 n=1 Tax=Megalobrama amblycephala TaxID=75352 RepID=UPI002013E603|nr:serum response factor-binding protein 1 isoform X2 [Megalobrama amblycephala]
MPAVLNLSNEVVKMRAEVKRVKVLLIRKLSRQISRLEKKKGNEAAVEKFRRRAAKLREEIHELKVVVPDNVTKAALQKDISFDKVCRDKEASLSDRATARIATHPQFSKRIQSIKAAIKAFKDERINARKAEKQAINKAENVTSQGQPQEDGNDDDVGTEKSNDDDEKLKEEEGDKKTNEQQEEIDGFSQESQKTSLETLKEQTNQCRKEETLTVEDSSETVAVPMEVIRMRKEVKRTRVLIISKMVEQVAALKKKKGQESEVKESQERAAEILKEIQALRRLKPDQVTMTALQENAEHEKVLQDPQANPLDRAIARIITHSRFINKLQKVKEAIEEERAKAAKAELKNTDRLNMAESKNEYEEPEEKDEEPEEKDEEPEDDDDDDSKEDDEVVEEKLESFSTEIHKSGVVEPTESKDPDAFELPPSKIITTSSEKPKGDKDKLKNVEATVPNVQSSPEKSSTVSSTKSTPLKNVGKAVDEKLKSFSTEIHKSGVVEPTKSKDPDALDLPPSKIITTFSENTRGVKVKSQNAEASAPNTQSSSEKSSTLSSTKSTPLKNVGKADKEMEITSKTQKKQDLPETKKLEADEESDLSDDDEEEEEKEYFDDSTEERFHKQSSLSEDSDDDDFFLGKVSKLKKKKSNQKPDKKATRKPQETTLGKLQSVFCSTLSKSTVSSQKAKYGSHNDGSRPSRFQSQSKGPESRMKASQYKGQDVGTDRRMGPFKPNRQTFKVAGQRQAGPSGAGRGRPQFEQYQNQNPRGPPGNMSNPPQQTLHPSWEASRKRKEQQAQITAFQGKKIRFDDDD